jgi:hypothetical protein
MVRSVNAAGSQSRIPTKWAQALGCIRAQA